MTQDDWRTMLEGHPIFTLPNGCGGQSEESLDLSTSTLKKSILNEGPLDVPRSGRRQVMVLKDSDLIVAAGYELRITSLSASKLGRSTNNSFKILNTPNIQFWIHQIALNPSGKLIAVAGAHQVAVVVLPRAGYSKLASGSVDCKSIQVGSFYHHSHSSAPIAKIEWHPWGEAGSTLMIMTVDGKLREYDISVDIEEPQQVLSFVPEKKTSKSYLAEDPAEREVASFTLGKGKADWGPAHRLCCYEVRRHLCHMPYMPQNASVPSSYVHALECFISAKQEFLSQGASSGISVLSTLYDYQRKYVTTLLKQLPAGTVYPAISRSFSMHPPMTIKSQPMRQGPFLLQPSPRSLEDSEGGDATDIAYLAFIRDDDDEDAGETERLGILIVTHQDGKVDVCLDVEKVEARWESKGDKSQDLPMLAVYECIDLGLISMLKQTSPLSSGTPALDLLQANRPILLMDPIHDDTVYVYHAFGVHSAGTHVVPLVNTYSVDRRCSNPIIAGSEDFLAPIEGPSAYVSLLGTEPFVPPLALLRPSGPPSNPRIAVGTPDTKTEFVLTPETLRNLGSTIEGLTSQIHKIILAYKATEVRAELQAKEFERQQQKCGAMLDLIEQLSGLRNSEVKERLERIREAYRALASRLDHRLQTLMQQASPKLSEYETKWFEELRRMKAEIAGAGRYDEQSLAARTSLLKREYDRMLPSLNDMAVKEAERKRRLCESGLGLSQAFQFGERTNQERTKIAELEETIMKMASKLELSLARPPSLRETPQN
ncbi:hypothetical protein BDR07DRAFT_1387385 [Suillus spraguei]|nr:hypothetical protein BDR07DRAFT_1387385 [Suillus spraguei]